MTGVVLSGGKSSRMGSDKGLLSHEGMLWAEIALSKLLNVGIASGISVNALQKSEYELRLGNRSFFTDNDTLDVNGPLRGVLSVHELYPEEDLFLLACDMLLINDELILQVFDASQENPEQEAFIFTNNNEQEPLCGIYTSKGLKKIRTLLEAGKLERYSMKFVLDRLAVHEIALTPAQQVYFKNFNDPAAVAQDR